MTKAEAFKEVYTKKPKTVSKSKHGAAFRAQLVAIALSKAGMSNKSKKK
jgi:hypothetical protein